MLSIIDNVLTFFNKLMEDPAEYAFYIAIAAAILLLVIVFIVTICVNKSKKKKLAKLAGSQNQEPVVEEVVEEPVAEEAVEESVAEEVVEESKSEQVEEEEMPKKETKKSPAKKATPKKESVAKTTTKKTVKNDTPSPVVEEPKTASKGRTYNGKYEVYPNGDGYQYRLKASNGEILIVSETYVSREGVMKAIDAVKRNIETGEVRIIEDKHGMFKFKLTSKNYRVIALGSNYTTEKSAVRASESFKKFALKADIVEIETPVDQDAGSATVINLGKVEDKTGGKFIVEKFNGEYSWDLKASNGQILCQAEGYTSRVGVLSSIESFKKNAETGVYKVVRDKNDNYHYKIYSAGGRVAAIGETYSTKQLAESAAASAASYYKNAEIVENNEVKTQK